MRLTEELAKRVHRDIADPGPPAGTTVFTEAGYDEHLRSFLRDKPEGPLHVFAYGSLIWKPVFAPAAVTRGTAIGWSRAFCLKLVRFRGTADVPGLMMQIDRGGECEGVLHQVEAGREWQDLSLLWRREMTTTPPGNYPRWIEVDAGGQRLLAIAFTANPESPNYIGGLAIDHVAETLSKACGHWGSGADYLRQTVSSLLESGIHDSYLWELQERVAKLIEGRFPI